MSRQSQSIKLMEQMLSVEGSTRRDMRITLRRRTRLHILKGILSKGAFNKWVENEQRNYETFNTNYCRAIIRRGYQGSW